MTSNKPAKRGMERHFSEDKFWSKIKKYSGAAGRELIEKVLLLYYVMTDPDVPAWVKLAVAGALGYFIFPLDALLDPIFVDDLAVVVTVLAQVAEHVTPAAKEKAARKAAEIFGAA